MSGPNNANRIRGIYASETIHDTVVLKFIYWQRLSIQTNRLLTLKPNGDSGPACL